MMATHVRLQRINGKTLWCYNRHKVRPLPRITGIADTPAKAANDTGDHVTQAKEKDEGG